MKYVDSNSQLYEVILECDSKFSALIIEVVCEPPTLLLDKIKENLKIRGIKGRILIDSLLYEGNSNKRFIEVYFDGNEYIKDSFEFTNIERGNKIRKITSDYLRGNNELLEYSILTLLQKKMINNGLNL